MLNAQNMTRTRRRSVAALAVSLFAVLSLSGCSLIPASWTVAFGGAIGFYSLMVPLGASEAGWT